MWLFSLKPPGLYAGRDDRNWQYFHKICCYSDSILQGDTNIMYVVLLY
jgi:hypothetical protein